MKDYAPDFEAQREQMVTRDIERRGIHDPRVLAAFRAVPREKFVPPEELPRAYADHPLSIGHGQTISQPYIVALMAEILEVEQNHKVLEIGTGSGYQTAILAELAAEVYTIERVAPLSETAERRLQEMGYTNVHFMVGDGTLGWPEEAPFDRVTVSAAAPHISKAFEDQLVEEGVVVIPVGGPHAQNLIAGRKRGGKLREKFICGCVFVRLIGEDGWT